MLTSEVPCAAARLDRLPILAFHRRLLFLVGAGLFFDAFDIYLANSVLSSLVKSEWSTLQLNATFLSATAVGMLLGSVMAGILADRYGRKFSYQFNLALFGLASLGCALAPNMSWLIAARFICGVGLGAELVIGYGLLTEFVPPGHRGRWAALLSCMAQFGLFFSTLTSWLVIPVFGWRAMFVIAGAGALVVFFARKVIPESPRWLESKGRIGEAQEIVADIEAGAGLSSLPSSTPSASVAATVADVRVFSNRLRQPLLLGALTQIIQSVAIYGFVAWVPTFLVKQGMPINQTLGLAVLMSFGGPAGAFLAFLLTDRVGRRPAIIGGSLLAALLGPLFALASSQMMAVVLGFAMFTLIYFLVSVIQAGYLPELFPTAVRMRATSLCVTAGRITSIGLPFTIVALFEWQGVMAVVGLVSILLALQISAVLLLGRETRGQSLEAIGERVSSDAVPATDRVAAAS